MNLNLKQKVVAGYICTGIILSATGILYFAKAGLVRETFAGLAFVAAVILLFLFIKIRLLLQELSDLRQQIIDLHSAVDERSLKQTENEKIYRSLAANIPGSAITILDREERYLLAEGDMLERMGYQKENMPGRKISDVIVPENYKWYKTLIDEAFSGKTLLTERHTMSGLDALIRVVPLRNEDGVIYAIMFVLLDVTVVKQVQRELAELNANLEIKIAERTEQLEELNKELEGFAYSVSHDLRAPLRAVVGYSKVLQEDQGAKMDDDGRQLLEKVIQNGMRMNQLIDDLLEFSRAGRGDLKRSRIDMDGLVREITQELSGHEGARKLNILHHPLADSVGDLNLIRQVWFNLISNALKYTRKKESAEIEIKSVLQNGNILYSIRDNGAGFDMAYVDKLFGVFQRLHKMNDFEGTGVGLALVKTIIKRHKGKIWAEAKVDEGAQFFFTLPKISTQEIQEPITG